ncbi:MAG TPA: tetratricopeptide repeat protein [Gemmata sp.]|jgi:tetratricopeptide (TPR) repeat protein|nr:tetratricopeptide repeat protein [Gemmata sp.]
MDDILTAALELHQSGQLEPAAQLYQKVLFQERDNASALHLLGVLHDQQGQHARAVEEIGRAVALRPNIPAFHANLAEAYRSLGQFERAVGCCRTALRLWADFPEAHCNLGLALQGLGRHTEAVEQFHRALRLRPDFAAAHNNLGITLRELGQFEDALRHFFRAVQLAPDYPPARTNLGQLLLDRGKPEKAVPHCREAVRLQPDLAPAHHNLGNALRAIGQLVDARSAYLEAIRLDANLAISHTHLGLVLQQDNHLDDALVWLKQAVELEPRNPDFREYLADLHMEREEFAEAIPCWEQALALEPNRPSAHSGLGWALHEVGRSAEASQHYREALRLKPDFAAARMSLGGLHEEIGELTEAETAFREALELQPTFALPHGRLATLLRGKLSEADQSALEGRLADPKLADGPRARLLFALGHVLDGRGEFARAAECLQRANALTAEMNRKQKREYVPVEHERFVDKLLSVFGPEFFARALGSGLDTRRPVFIFGLPRSGTTLVEQVLASHSRVFGAGELRLGRQTFEAIPSILNRSDAPVVCVPNLDRAAIRRLAEQHLEGLRVLDGNAAERIVDKMPDNYLYLGLLAALFPQAAFIHCRRDLRDVAVSSWMTDFRSIRWANDPEHIASRFRQYRRLMQHWQTVLPVPVHEVVYEQLIDDFETEARRLLTSCSLEWEPACGRFHETARPVRTASVTQVRQPLYRRGLARWKHYEVTLSDLFARLPID